MLLIAFTLPTSLPAWDYLNDTPVLPIQTGLSHCPPFTYWIFDEGSGKGRVWTVREHLASSGRKAHSKGNPQIPKDTVLARTGSLPPVCGSTSGSLGLNEGIPSPDGRWSIRVETVRTFSEDLKNVWLEVSDAKSRSSERTVVPGHSLGEACGLFWDRTGHFYLLNLTGPEGRRSYRLIRFDPNQDSFSAIGISDGRAFLSPNGSWIVWETGQTPSPASREVTFHIGTLIGYETSKNENFYLTDQKVQAYFDHWQ